MVPWWSVVPWRSVELRGSKDAAGVGGLHHLPSPRRKQDSSPRGCALALCFQLQEHGAPREPRFPSRPWVHLGGISGPLARTHTLPCVARGVPRVGPVEPGTAHRSRAPCSLARAPPLLGCPPWSGVGSSSSLFCSPTQTLPWLPRSWPLPHAWQNISLNLGCHQCKVFHYFMNQEEKTLGIKLDTMFSYHLEFAFGSSWKIFSLARCLSLLCTHKNGEHKQGRSFNLFLDVLCVFRYGSSGSSSNEELSLVVSASCVRG